MPTYDRADMLRERSIPSVLAQTYQNFEIVVVGDAAPDAVGEALASIGDPRIRFVNQTVRGPYSPWAEHAWMAVGTPPYNRAMAEAEGLWLAPLDDDDSFTPDHIERLLADARERRLELVYGLLRCRYPDGSEDFIGEFPPQTEFTELRSSFGLQAAILHTGLRFMQMHLTDPLFGLANDVALSRRMIRAGRARGDDRRGRVGLLPRAGVGTRAPGPDTKDRSAVALSARGPRWQLQRAVWALTPPVPLPLVRRAARRLGLVSPPRARARPRRARARARRVDPGSAPPHWEYVPEGFARPAKGWNVAAISDAYREKWPSYLAAHRGDQAARRRSRDARGEAIGWEDHGAHNTLVSYAYVLALAAGGRDRISVLDWAAGSATTCR